MNRLERRIRDIDKEVFTEEECSKGSKMYYVLNEMYALKKYLNVKIGWHYEDDPYKKKPKAPQIVVWEAKKRSKKKGKQ